MMIAHDVTKLQFRPQAATFSHRQPLGITCIGQVNVVNVISHHPVSLFIHQVGELILGLDHRFKCSWLFTTGMPHAHHVGLTHQYINLDGFLLIRCGTTGFGCFQFSQTTSNRLVSNRLAF